MKLLAKSFAGRVFHVVDPPSIGLTAHSADSFDDHDPMLNVLAEIAPGQVLVDVGACFGSYTLPALAMGADVLAFEPSRDGLLLLERNVVANGWGARCTIFPFVLSDGTPVPSAWTAEVFGAHYPASALEWARFDDVVGAAGLRRLDWMKLDVEGLEWHVLEGARESIERWRPTLLIEDHDEVNPGVGCQVSDYPASIGSAGKIHAMLTHLGYRIEVRPWDVSRKFLVARP